MKEHSLFHFEIYFSALHASPMSLHVDKMATKLLQELNMSELSFMIVCLLFLNLKCWQNLSTKYPVCIVAPMLTVQLLILTTWMVIVWQLLWSAKCFPMTIVTKNSPIISTYLLLPPSSTFHITVIIDLLCSSLFEVALCLSNLAVVAMFTSQLPAHKLPCFVWIDHFEGTFRRKNDMP